MATPVLSNTVRIAGECRTYRIAATVAPEKDSGGALLLRTGLFHLATTRMTPKNDTKFATKPVATPATDMIVPASAGPTARARLNSIPLSAEAAARFLGHQIQGGLHAIRRFERVCCRERKCEHQEYPWRHHSCDGKDR